MRIPNEQELQDVDHSHVMKFLIVVSSVARQLKSVAEAVTLHSNLRRYQNCPVASNQDNIIKCNHGS